MAQLNTFKKGSTSRQVYLLIVNPDGSRATSVLYNSTGAALWYRREGSAKVAITLVTLAALTTAWTSGGFLHVGDGVYRLDVPDAAWATGANDVEIGGSFTSLVVFGGTVKLVNYDPEDAVRMGLSSLPNANAEASGGLYTRGTGAGQINQANNGQIDSNAARTGGTTNTGRDIGASVLLAANSVNASALATDAVTEIVAAFFAYAFSSAYLSLTFEQGFKVLLAEAIGKVSGADGTALAIRNPADTGTVIAATVDPDGNRTAVTVTP